MLYWPIIFAIFILGVFVGSFMQLILGYLKEKFWPIKFSKYELSDLHVGIVMDGNRRWAKNRGLPVTEGHRRGGKVAEQIIEFASCSGISHLTLYVLSIENLGRSDSEKNGLFDLAEKAFLDWSNKAEERNIKIRVFGDRSLFPERLAEKINSCEQKSKSNSGLNLNILFCYGGQQEIISGAAKLCQKVEFGEIRATDVDKKVFQESIWTADLPDPDLIIRTGGRKRLSNFLTFSSVYSEIYFEESLWPEFSVEKLKKMIDMFFSTFRSKGR